MSRNGNIAVIYTRVSTQAQFLRGSGIERQVQICKEYAKQHSLIVSAMFCDICSGNDDPRHRPGFISIIDQASKNEWDIMLIEATDRLSRGGVAQYRMMLSLLENSNMKIQVCSQIEIEYEKRIANILKGILE